MYKAQFMHLLQCISDPHKLLHSFWCLASFNIPVSQLMDFSICCELFFSYLLQLSHAAYKINIELKGAG